MIARRVFSGAGPRISSDVTQIASQIAVEPRLLIVARDRRCSRLHAAADITRRRRKPTRSIARRSRVRLLVIPCSSVASPVKEMIATSSFSGRTTIRRNEIAAAFSSGSVRSCEMLVSISIARLSGRSIWRENADDLLRLAVFENPNVALFESQSAGGGSCPVR